MLYSSISIVVKPRSSTKLDDAIHESIAYAKAHDITVSLEQLQPGLEAIEVFPDSTYTEIKLEYVELLNDSKR